MLNLETVLDCYRKQAVRLKQRTTAASPLSLSTIPVEKSPKFLRHGKKLSVVSRLNRGSNNSLMSLRESSLPPLPKLDNKIEGFKQPSHAKGRRSVMVDEDV